MNDLLSRLQDEADLCRNETATDIANLLDEAVSEIKKLHEWADAFSDKQLEERRTGEDYQRELRAELLRLRFELKCAGDKLDEISLECSECDGTGVLHGEHGFQEECASCSDIRLACFKATAAAIDDRIGRSTDPFVVKLTASDMNALGLSQGDAEAFGIGFLKLTPSGFEHLNPEAVTVRTAVQPTVPLDEWAKDRAAHLMTQGRLTLLTHAVYEALECNLPPHAADVLSKAIGGAADQTPAGPTK